MSKIATAPYLDRPERTPFLPPKEAISQGVLHSLQHTLWGFCFDQASTISPSEFLRTDSMPLRQEALDL